MPTTAISHGSAIGHPRTVIGCLCSRIDAASRYHRQGVPHPPHGNVTPAQQLSEVGIKVVYPYPPGQLPAGSSVQTLLGEQQALLPAACQPSVAGRGRQLRQAAGGKQSQHWQHTLQHTLQHPVEGLGTATSDQLRLQDSQQQRQQQQLLPPITAQLPAPSRALAGQLRQRPLHGPSDGMKLVQLLQNSSTLPQLQAVVDVHLQRMPPLALTVAMQQVQHIKQHQRAQTQLHQQQRDMFLQHSERQLAEQLSRALLAWLPHVSTQTLTAFLSAAAASRVILPPVVLEQLASDLVHRALRAACQERQQGQQQQQQPQQQVRQLPGKASTQMQRQPFNSLQQQSSAGSAGLGSMAIQQQQQQLQPPHGVAAAAWALAKLRLSSPAVWAELCSLAGEQLHQFSPRDCVLLSWGLAKQHHLQPRLFHAVQQQLSQYSLQQLSPDSIAQLLWCCARLSHHHPGWVSALVLTATRNMERFSPRALSIMLWACAKLRHYEPHLLSAVRVQALATMAGFEPQCLSMFCWALARLGVRDDQLLEAVMQRAMQVVDGFTMQGLANVAWSATKMIQQMAASSTASHTGSIFNSSSPATNIMTSCGHNQEAVLKRQQRGFGRQQQRRRRQQVAEQRHQLLEELLQRCCDAAVPVLQSAQPQEVCNLLWACATARLRHSGFLDAAAQALASSAASLSPLDLAQAVWGLEVLGHRRRAQQQRLVQAGLNSLHLFGAQALSNWCWAIAASGMAAPQGLPAAVARQVEVLLPQFSPQGLATTLWALSKLGHAATQLLHAAGPFILAGITSYNAQDLCNIAMACCKAHHREPTLVGGLAQAAAAAAASTLAAYSGGGVAPVSLLLPPPGVASPGGVSSWGPGPAGAPAQPAAPAGGISRLAGRQVPALQLPASGRAAAPANLSPAYAALWRAQQAKQLTRQGVCNLVWAFSGLGWYDEALVRQLQQLAALSMQQGKLRKATHVAGLLQGFARLSEPLPLLLDAMLEGSGAQRSRASSSSKSSKSSKTMYRNKPTANTSSVQSTQLSLVGKQDDLTEIGAWNRVLAQWPEDALSLLVWAAATTGAHLTHASCLAAAVRLLRQHGVSPLSPQRCEQLHLALLLLATDWGLLGWAVAGPKQDRLHQSGSSSICSSPAGGQIYSRSRGRSTSSAHQPQHHETLQHAIIVLLQELAARCTPTCGHYQASSAVVSRAQEEVLHELRALRLQPLVDHWLSPGAPHAASQGAGLGVSSVTGTAVESDECVQAVDAAAAGLAPGLEARLGLPCSSSPWLYDGLADSLHVRLGVRGGWLGEARCPVALELLPPASLTSSWPRRVLGATGLHHDCLRAAGWDVVLLPLEDWEASMQTGHQQQLLKQLLKI